MDARRFAVGTLVGGIVLYATGYLIFQLALGGFYEANVGSATGVVRESPLLWPVALGSLSYAALIVYAGGSRTGTLTVPTGAQIGAIVGFLLWCSVDFILYGTTNISNLTRTIVDPVLEIVHGGIGGAAIAAVLPIVSKSAHPRHAAV